MNTALMPNSYLRWRAFRARLLVAALAVFMAFASSGSGQGTMTFTFEGPPRGTEWNVGGYISSGMSFEPIFPGNLLLNGGGIPGYPDNGTSYLEVPDGFQGIGGLTFGFTNVLPSTYFNLVSFDAAEYDGAGPQTLEVIGYKPMVGTVTNFFSINSLSFQTFYLDASFTGLFKVDVRNARWSLDNLVISGVPEPSTGSLAWLGAGGAVAWSRFRRKNRQRQMRA